jgi:hypothetical protein
MDLYILFIIYVLSINSLRPKNSEIAAYFEAGRRGGKRSILGVCEHFRHKPDAIRGAICGFLYQKWTNAD